MLKQLLKYGAIKIFETTNLVKSCTCQKNCCFYHQGVLKDLILRHDISIVIALVEFMRAVVVCGNVHTSTRAPRAQTERQGRCNAPRGAINANFSTSYKMS